MKSPQEIAMFTVPSLTDVGDFHLLVMGGLVFLTAVGAVLSVSLLLLVGPVLQLALGCHAPRRGSRRRESSRSSD
ncbi:hypothetical protein [Paenarthrobacter sp. NPDC058040]|uniref:hypothetical protein n=1 Tax=unclassified Paenarthrobacter TaxID=2634190 RepID=UPI0036DC3766